MKSRLVLSAVALMAVVSNASAEGLFLEVGSGYARFSGAEYSLSSILPPAQNTSVNTVPTTLVDTEIKDDKSAMVFQIAAGYEVSDWLSLRLDYQHFGRTTAVLNADVVIASTQAGVGGVTVKYSDQVESLTFAPEFRCKATEKLTLLFAPELNWVFSNAVVRTTTTYPSLAVDPLIKRSDDDLLFGASIGAEYALSDTFSVTARYRYMDLDVSWGRDVSVFSSGVKWEF